MSATETNVATGEGDRGIAHRLPPETRLEGAGTRITRWFVPSDTALTDPFLLFDQTKSDRLEDYAGGFPEHPHRGFEALTYLLAGRLRHRDSAGYTGDVGALGAQWLTNASGLTHDEVPDQSDGWFWCLQLWINLPAEYKRQAPFYDEAPAEAIPEVGLSPGERVRVIAGSYGGRTGPLPPRPRPSEPVYLDVHLEAGARLDWSPQAGFNVLLHGLEGEVRIGPRGERLAAGEVVVLERAGGVHARAYGAPARFLVMGGRPIGEPVAWRGPFVMNTEAELERAFTDFAEYGPFRSDAGTGRANEP